MTRLLCVLLLAGCTHRALDVPGPQRDLASADLTAIPDFTVLADFAGVDLAGDMARPHYCDGIYVIDIRGTLLFFDPVKLTFTNVATLSCPTGFASPNSMALARDGTAYVDFEDGSLYRVDSTTGACSATSFSAAQSGFVEFGMGFASNAPGSSAETLFVANSDGSANLATIDTTTFALSVVGQLVPGQVVEMTGTGAGELWGFFRTNVGHVGLIDKQTATLKTDIPLPQLGDVSADGFAFGFYGGLFYAFLYNPPGTTEVWRIDTTKQTATRVLSNTGLEIVGSGVSTCAPTN